MLWANVQFPEFRIWIQAPKRPSNQTQASPSPLHPLTFKLYSSVLIPQDD